MSTYWARVNQSCKKISLLFVFDCTAISISLIIFPVHFLTTIDNIILTYSHPKMYYANKPARDCIEREYYYSGIVDRPCDLIYRGGMCTTPSTVHMVNSKRLFPIITYPIHHHVKHIYRFSSGECAKPTIHYEPCMWISSIILCHVQGLPINQTLMCMKPITILTRAAIEMCRRFGYRRLEAPMSSPSIAAAFSSSSSLTNLNKKSHTTTKDHLATQSQHESIKLKPPRSFKTARGTHCSWRNRCGCLCHGCCHRTP